LYRSKTCILLNASAFLQESSLYYKADNWIHWSVLCHIHWVHFLRPYQVL